jgi:hypothetical protein
VLLLEEQDTIYTDQTSNKQQQQTEATQSKQNGTGKTQSNQNKEKQHQSTRIKSTTRRINKKQEQQNHAGKKFIS